jgi:type I restriction enzyme S subunit
MTEHVLPRGWSRATLKDLLLRVEAGRSPQCEPRVAGPREFGVIKVSAMTYGHFRADQNKALPPGSDVDPGHEIRGGDLLVSRANTPAYVGAAVVVPESVRQRLLLSDKSLRLVLHPEVDTAWLRWALASPVARRQIEAAATGTKDSMRNISQANLLSVQLDVPPADEQRRIAMALEEQLALIDAAASDGETLRGRVGRLTDIVLNDVVCRARFASGRATPTSEVADITGGIQKQPKRHPVGADDGLPFLRVANVGRRTLDLSDVHRILVTDTERDRVTLQQGDLLVVEGNGSPDQIGRAALWRGAIDPCTHQNHLIRVRPGEELIPEFLEMVWNAPTTVAQLKQVASTTSGLYTLSTKKVAAVRIPVPSLAVQKELVAEAEQKLALAVRSLRDLDPVRRRLDVFRRSVLAAAFSGRLVPQDPTDEPAELLLKRIAEDRAAREPAATNRRARTVTGRRGARPRTEETA